MSSLAESKALQEGISQLDSAETDSDRRSAVVNLITFLRAALPDRALLDGFLSSSIDEQERTKILGALAVEIARTEFLLGWSHIGGVASGGASAWEHDGKNRGEFPNHYLKASHLFGQDTEQRWCAAFAGQQLVRVGFAFADALNLVQANSIFWSCSRLEHWAETGQTKKGQHATAAAGRIADGGASHHIASTSWDALAEDLDSVTQSSAKTQIVDTFAKQNALPQAGDIVLFERHAMMVEQWDSSKRSFTTIEGNAGNAVRSRKLMLTDARTARKIRNLIRIGADFFLPTSSVPELDLEDAAVVGQSLVEDATGVVSELVRVASRHSWILSEDPRASTLQWLGGASAGDVTE